VHRPLELRQYHPKRPTIPMAIYLEVPLIVLSAFERVMDPIK
jgi:hypothetical protein